MKIILFLVFLFWVITIQSQEQQAIEKSNIIVTKNNKKYYKHPVKKGETLYRIAKAYQISVDDIAYENPFVFNGLKANDTLFIPIASIKVDYIEYEIKKGETLYSIAKKHGVSIEEIIQVNPQVTRGIKTGDKIKIPQRELASYEFTEKKPIINSNNSPSVQPSIQNGDTTFYIVKKGETVYRICKSFNLTEDEFYKLNPSVKTEGLKTEQKVILSIKKKQETVKKDTATSKNLILFPKGDSSKITKNINCREINKRNIIITINDNFKDYYTKLNEDLNVTNVGNVKTNYSYLEFYEGLLLGCDFFKKENYNITINTSKDINNVSESDVIISFTSIPDYKNNIPVFVVNYDSLINENFYFFQCSIEDKVKQFAKFLSKIDSLNIIVVTTNYDYNNINDIFISTLKYNMRPTSKYIVINYSEKGDEGIKHSLNSSLTNIIFSSSRSQVFVIQLMNTLNILTKLYKISLCYFPEWISFDKNLDIEQLFNLNTIKFDNFSIDFSSVNVDNFIKGYTNIFKKNPTINAFIGYDIGIYLCENIGKFGMNFPFCMNSSYIKNTLSSSISFEGNYNNGIIVSLYDNETKTLKPIYYFRKENFLRIKVPDIKVRK